MLKKMLTLRKRTCALILALVTIVSIFSVSTVYAAEDYDGSWAFATSTTPVYSNPVGGSQIGTIYGYEGVTLLKREGSSCYIEYSTPNGAKRGYVQYGLSFMDPSCVAKVTRTSTLYYGNNTSVYQASGTVYAGEFVSVLAKNDNWVYVEYNTNSGRKRGYMSYSNLYCYNRPDVFLDLYNYNNAGYVDYVNGSYNVYSGPSTQYPIIGSISNENVTFLDGYSMDGVYTWSYIEYYVNGTSQKKSGFILPR